jgi:hypothetical protein
MPVLKKHYLLIIVLLGGCSSYTYINMDVLQPAKYNLPVDLDSVCLVYKSTNIPEAKLTERQISTQKYYLFNALEGLRDELKKSPKINNIHIIEQSAEAKKPSLQFTQLPWDEVEKVCDIHDSKALISLEHVVSNDTFTLRYDTKNYEYVIRLSFENKALWRIYIPEGKRIVDEYIFRDTVTYTGRSFNQDLAMNKLPHKSLGRAYAYYVSGAAYAKRIVPLWEKSKRFIYNPCNIHFWKANRQAENGNWDEAVAIWRPFVNGKNREFAAKAAYNIAIAHEMKDELDKAMEWAQKSSEIIKYPKNYHYIENLKKRIKKKEMLIRQLK